jgi:glutathione S-transferase
MINFTPVGDDKPLVKDKDLLEAYVGELEHDQTKHSLKYKLKKYIGFNYAAKQLRKSQQQRKQKRSRREEIKRLSSSNKLVEEKAALAKTRNELLKNELRRQKLSFRRQRQELEQQLEQIKDELSVQEEEFHSVKSTSNQKIHHETNRPRKHDPPGMRVDFSGHVLPATIVETNAATDEPPPLEETKSGSYPLTLLHADFCPFANRALIALLEKEADPLNPTKFEKRHVCYQMGRKKDKGTELLYSLDQKTVPVVIDNDKGGEVIAESMVVVEYVDDLYTDNHPLQPSDLTVKKKMKLYMDRYGNLPGAYYKLLMMQDSVQQQSLADDLLKLLSKLDIDLQVCPGPYLCGEQFTIPDIQIFPFVERIVHVLGHFREFIIPEELVHVHQWYKDVSDRPSVRVATGDRDEESMNTYCMVEQARGNYLIETYECYANNELVLAKKLTEESGAPGVNPYAEYKRKKETDTSYPLMLLHAEFCPFSSRAIIALLEKEKDPSHQINFRIQHVCFPLGPDNDKGTEMLYSLDLKEVPVLVDNEKESEATSESMVVIEHVDELYPDFNPLQPSETDRQETMRIFINRYDRLVGVFHSFLFMKDPSQKETIMEDMSDLLMSLENDLQVFPGPYLCGEQFTLADIQIFPFMERVQVVLSHYRGFVIPEHLEHVHEWFKAVYARPSIRVATGDRDEESMKTYRMVERTRSEFLIESYECYAAWKSLGRWESIRARNSTETMDA